MTWFRRKALKAEHRDERLIFEARQLGERLIKTADRLEVVGEMLKVETERIQRASGNKNHGGDAKGVS